MTLYFLKQSVRQVTVFIVTSAFVFLVAPAYALADPACGGGNQQQVKTAIDFGCKQQGNAIMDLTFAILRFLSDGVGLVVVTSLIIAGIQYAASKGDPNATAAAITRIRSNVVALLIFIFAYAIINYIVPGTFLKNS